jgi:branched-chain amino acid transport system substrate-binding protein
VVGYVDPVGAGIHCHEVGRPAHANRELPSAAAGGVGAVACRGVDHRNGPRLIAVGVVYQSCDDSTAQSGFSDTGKCTSDAKAYVHNPRVIGVIGPYDSNCAQQEIPIANQGGLAMISPANSLVWLTHTDSLTPPGFLRQLYPTGSRNARVFPADDVEAAAIAEFARHLQLRSVYVLDNGATYGADMALHFKLSARLLGLHLAGSSTYSNPDTFGRLAARVARSGAKAVFLGGLLEDGPLIRALRRQLGPRFTILADDGFLPPGLLFQTDGPAARGVYVAADVLPDGPLGLAGRDFVAHFAATQPHAPLNEMALYAAQATDVMIDAIARSDGTRRSVTHALFKTCVHNGILGSFCFDANGDPTRTGISIVKTMRPGGDRTTPENTQGAHLVTVIYPPGKLLR